MTIPREALGYVEPAEGPAPYFAQCATCFLFDRVSRCAIHGDKVKIAPDDSCIYYAWGPYTGASIEKLVTPKESQLVHRQVRCENCRFSRTGRCRMYEMLNAHLPGLFKLDPKIKPEACCNLQEPLRR